MRRHQRGGHPFRNSRARERHRVHVVGGDVREGAAALPPCVVVPGRDRGDLVGAPIGLPEQHQLAGPVVGQRREEVGARQRQHGRVRADAQGQRPHRHERVGRAPAQPADRPANVGHHASKPTHATLLARAGVRGTPGPPRPQREAGHLPPVPPGGGPRAVPVPAAAPELVELAQHHVPLRRGRDGGEPSSRQAGRTFPGSHSSRAGSSPSQRPRYARRASLSASRAASVRAK